MMSGVPTPSIAEAIEGVGMHVSTKERRLCMQAEGQHLFNPLETIRANKVARGLLSPFQMKDLQLAYAVA